MDFTLDPDWWPSLDVVDVMGGGLYFSIDWRAKKFPGFQMEWSPHWTEDLNSPFTLMPRSSLD